MIKRKIEIQNKLGLHARASAKLVSCAGRFGSKIEIARNNKTVNGKSIMSVMMLAASKGTELEFIVDGDDEDKAVDALEMLINDKFGED